MTTHSPRYRSRRGAPTTALLLTTAAVATVATVATTSPKLTGGTIATERKMSALASKTRTMTMLPLSSPSSSRRSHFRGSNAGAAVAAADATAAAAAFATTTKTTLGVKATARGGKVVSLPMLRPGLGNDVAASTRCCRRRHAAAAAEVAATTEIVGTRTWSRLAAVTNGDGDGGGEGEEERGRTEEEKFDQIISNNDLHSAVKYMRYHPNVDIDQKRFLDIFDAIEIRTSEAEENNINTRMSTVVNDMSYPPVSPARTGMNDMYRALSDLGHLRLFGAAGRDGRPYPAMGSKTLTPTLLEEITDMDMVSLTPKPTNTLLFGGVALAILEGIVSLSTGIDLNFLVFSTLFFAFLDKLLLNGAIFETTVRILMPEYGKKILRHEAGHFLCAYLLGCPVEGCVLSPWAALRDSRFGGRATTVSAGTSFFDPDLSDEINGLSKSPLVGLSRASIDRYSVIVMAGIAAEAIEYGRADGGAGDEMALVRFLSGLNPKAGRASAWTADRIKNQARWGAVQAVLLLREYRHCYDALVDALERGGNLGQCVWSIENAARTGGIEPLKEPLGYILEKGLYGEWATVLPGNGDASLSVQGPPATNVPVLEGAKKSPGPVSSPSSSSSEMRSDELGTSRETLSQYRRMMEEKLKKIDEQLEDINRSE